MTDRRRSVPFDPEHYTRLAAAGRPVDPESAFRHAYRTNFWGGAESPSGPGASLDQTARIRAALPDLCRRLAVETLLDLPCGDCHWIVDVELPVVRYVGADFLPELIASNIARYGALDRRFRRLDLTATPLPAADLLLCRDCLVHLSFTDIGRAVANIAAAEIGYLLTTTFPEQPTNEDIATGDWRPLNLQAPPFDWPAPMELINEGCTESNGLFADKSLGLWRVSQLPTA